MFMETFIRVRGLPEKDAFLPGAGILTLSSAPSLLREIQDVRFTPCVACLRRADGARHDIRSYEANVPLL